MANGKVQAFEQAVMNVARGTNATGFTAYVGLLSTAATDTTAGTEISGSSYARQLAGFSAPSGSAPSTMSNAAEINFPVATTAGYTIVQVGIYDASTAGTLRAITPSFAGVAIVVGGQARIAAGALQWTED